MDDSAAEQDEAADAGAATEAGGREDDAPAQALWAERTGTRTYTGRNERGGEVMIGSGQGAFSPGELLQLATAACAALSADHRLAYALGDDFAATVGVSADKDKENNRYRSLSVELVTDLSSLDEKQLATTVERSQLAIDRQCTVGRTLDQPVPHTVVFTSEEVG